MIRISTSPFTRRSSACQPASSTTSGSISSVRPGSRMTKLATSAPHSSGCHCGWRAVKRWMCGVRRSIGDASQAFGEPAETEAVAGREPATAGPAPFRDFASACCIALRRRQHATRATRRSRPRPPSTRSPCRPAAARAAPRGGRFAAPSRRAPPARRIPRHGRGRRRCRPPPAAATRWGERTRAIARSTRSAATEALRLSVSAMITPDSVPPTRQATSSARTLPPIELPKSRIVSSVSGLSSSSPSTDASASATGLP